MPGQRKTEMISLIVGTMAVVVIIIGLIAAIEMILVIVCLFTGKDMTFISPLGRGRCHGRLAPTTSIKESMNPL